MKDKESFSIPVTPRGKRAAVSSREEEKLSGNFGDF